MKHSILNTLDAFTRRHSFEKLDSLGAVVGWRSEDQPTSTIWVIIRCDLI